MNKNVFPTEIPSAVFYNQDGRVVLSIYMQSNNQILEVKDLSTIDVSIYPNPTSYYVNIKSDKKLKLITLYSLDGRKLNEIRDSKVDLTSYPCRNVCTGYNPRRWNAIQT